MFGIGRHWSDAAARTDTRLPAPGIARYRAERRTRLVLVNAIIASTGVEISDWDGESYLLTEKGGRALRALDLSAVWDAVDRLSGERVDLLSESPTAHEA